MKLADCIADYLGYIRHERGFAETGFVKSMLIFYVTCVPMFGLNGNRLKPASGCRTVQQGATAPIRLATLPTNCSTAGYFDEDGIVPW